MWIATHNLLDIIYIYMQRTTASHAMHKLSDLCYNDIPFDTIISDNNEYTYM